jgi:hypothetical protein
MELTIKKVFDYPSVSSVFKGDNGAIGFGVVKVLVSRFAETFGFSTKLSEVQLESLTVDILDNFRYETLQDIILFLKMARSGKLGVTKKGIDSNLIIGEWLPIYLELKAIEREKIVKKEKDDLNSVQLTIEEVRAAYEKQKNNTFYNKVCDYVDKITEGITREELENLISEWAKDAEKKEYLRVLKRKRLTIK